MPNDPRLSRRAVLTGAGVLAVGAAAGVFVATRPSPESSAATSSPRPTSTAGAVGGPQRSFESTDLTVPAVTAWKTGTTAPGLLFVTQQVKGFNGLIMTESGEPVWIEPTRANVTDLKVQSYGGRPVLTYWTGTSSGGHGDGVGVILDESYAEVGRVSAGTASRRTCTSSRSPIAARPCSPSTRSCPPTSASSTGPRRGTSTTAGCRRSTSRRGRCCSTGGRGTTSPSRRRTSGSTRTRGTTARPRAAPSTRTT